MTHFARPTMPVNSPRCWCTVCGCMFLTHLSFDKHRGIKASSDENHQDRGRCWTVPEMARYGLSQEADACLWGTQAEWAQFRKFEAMRQARGQK